MQAKLAFTMAEILLSLTIIGVVAAITLPSLTGNINERTWNTQKKALYARFSQAISLMPSMNGYGELDATDSKNVAETFITSGLSKVLKINNICGNGNLRDCGISNKIINIKGTALNDFTTEYDTLVKYNTLFQGGPWSQALGSGVVNYSQIDTKAAAFETANGESVLTYYNPNCKGALYQTSTGSWNAIQPKVCANFVYDLNGIKGPNTVGKDIGFITVLYASDSVVVAPQPLNAPVGTLDAENYTYFTHAEAVSLCKGQDDEARLPNKDELAAMFVNRLLLGVNMYAFWSSSVVYENNSVTAWRQSFDSGNRTSVTRTSRGGAVWCVKR